MALTQKPIDDKTVIYARPNGWHYHLDKNCKMMGDGDFEKYGYVQIKKSEIKKRHLLACLCAYDRVERKE